MHILEVFGIIEMFLNAKKNSNSICHFCVISKSDSVTLKVPQPQQKFDKQQNPKLPLESRLTKR